MATALREGFAAWWRALISKFRFPCAEASKSRSPKFECL